MEYPSLQQLMPDGVIYKNEHLGTLEAFLPTGGFNTAHGPGLLEAENGDLLCVWFAGTFEGNADVSIVCARLPKGSGKWEAPVRVSHDPERSEQNPSLFQHPNGEIWALYTAQLDRVEGKDNMQYTSIVRRQTTRDFGRTWEEPEVLFPEEGTFCRQPIQILSNGRWIMGTWVCSDSEDGLAGDPTAFRISDDKGRTWRVVDMPKSNGRVHATLVELEDGHLVAFMRSRAADNIYRSESFDFGSSWSVPVPTELPNNNSSIGAVKLQSGRIAIVYNPTHAPDPDPDVCAWPGLRCPVAVALSEDGGMTFPLIRHMELGEGYVGRENSTNNRTYEYPTIIQSRDGMIHIAYAYKTREGVKWMSFSEEDVMGKKRETTGRYNPTSAQIT
ncbi:MAG: exo-alpha-sialidase [Oscillospiraceae bacterium]|nr:exo-alpha-sialidase [Oscillospiraceae bacterium]